MLKALLVVGSLFSAGFASATAGEVAPPAQAALAKAHAAGVKLAKGPAKKKEDPKAKKPEKIVPENAHADPRTSSPASSADAGASAPAPGGEARRGMSRIEFDDRLIQGQTNKANAIYLFERRESALRSLLKKRTDFHEEIDETLE